MRVDASVGYSGRAGLPRRNDDRRRGIGGVGGGGMGIGSTTRVCLPAHREYVWFYIFLKVTRLYADYETGQNNIIPRRSDSGGGGKTVCH